MRRKESLDVNEPSIDRRYRQETSGSDGRAELERLCSSPNFSDEWSKPLFSIQQDRYNIVPNTWYIIRNSDVLSFCIMLMKANRKWGLVTLDDRVRGVKGTFDSPEAAYIAWRLRK